MTRMLINASDFPGDEKIAVKVIKLLKPIYQDNALCSAMSVSRGFFATNFYQLHVQPVKGQSNE